MRYTLLIPAFASIMWAQTPTYHRDIAPVMANHCVSCHKPGEVGRFPLTTFDEVRQAGPAIHQAIRGQRMPPDQKDPHHGGDFYKRTLREKELNLVLKWIEAGMPEGDRRKR